MIADIQVIPTPGGTPEREFQHVEAAIEVIAKSGLQHEVHALGTTLEGPDDKVWETVRKAFNACLESGATKELMVLKLHKGPKTMDELSASGQAVARSASSSSAAFRAKRKADERDEHPLAKLRRLEQDENPGA
mmetsp:Transcript_84160/g.160781  ORF Transcript_84160/g.160781 Transcript_84160/m.160781 type:complete len:134 (+) Transcript_84160:61-462(+)